MESLSEVSTYLNELESMLNDGNSTMMVEDPGEVSTKANMDDGMDVIDTKENAKDYFDNYMSKALLNDLGYVRLDYDIDALLEDLVKNMVGIKDSSGEQVKMGKANHLKNYRVNKLTPPAPLKIEESPKPSSTPSQPIFHQLSPQQKENILKALERKYQELTKKKRIMKVLENYMIYRKKLDEVLMGTARCKDKDHMEEDRDKTLENGLPKKNVTLGAMIDMGHGTMTIDDGVIKHIYYSQPRTKAYLENFKNDEREDWMSCFEVGHDKDGNPQYGLIVPSFLDIENDMERALAMESYFNPFKNIIVFKKLIDFLSLLPVALKNND
nr:hypothetical protein [Tanacetum cinerariifolium]